MNIIESFACAADINLENILLCEILMSGKMNPDVLPEYFTGRRVMLFNAIQKQWTELKCIDPIVLKVTYPEEVINAITLDGSSSHAIIDQLKTFWKKRELAKTIYEAGKLENIDAIIGKIQAETGQIALKHSRGEYNHVQAMQELSMALEHNQKRNSNIAGYSTGITELDTYLSGIEKGKMYCFGALKKSGKSRFAIFLSIMMRKAGAGVLWNSLEMNAVQLNSCALAYFADVDQRMFSRRMNRDQYAKTATGFTGLSEMDWIICREKTVQNLRARIIHERNKKAVDVVIVDFIQRMQDESKENRAKEVEALSIQLADLSRELNIGMVVLSQLTGVAEKLSDDEMPNMSHMKESQSIAENADAIITLHNFDRRKNPFNADGSYRLQEIYCLIEQRYDVSGCCFRFLGDLRTCNFLNHSDPYGGRENK